VLGRKLPLATAPEINRSIYQELGRLGNNLNQLVRAVNSGIVRAVDADLLHQLAAEVRRLGQMLIQGRP